MRMAQHAQWYVSDFLDTMLIMEPSQNVTYSGCCLLVVKDDDSNEHFPVISGLMLSAKINVLFISAGVGDLLSNPPPEANEMSMTCFPVKDLAILWVMHAIETGCLAEPD